MFPNKPMFLQFSLPQPILAVESFPPCNIVLKLVVLIRTFQRKHTSTHASVFTLPTIPVLLFLACKGLSADTSLSLSLGNIFIILSQSFLEIFSFSDQFLASLQPGLCCFPDYCLCSSVTDTSLIFTAPDSSPSSMDF